MTDIGGSEVLQFAETDDPLLHRPIPSPDLSAQFFWESGKDGRLRIEQCSQCSYLCHPPTGHCPRCGSDQCSPREVSGRGTVYSYTVNYQEWVPGQVPYAIVIVELDEQQGLRLTSNMFGCEPGAVAIGVRVEVAFLHRHGYFYPVFVPDRVIGA